MKMIGLFLGIVGAVGTAGLMGQTPGQPATQPVQSRPRSAAAPATSPSKLIWRGLDLSAAPVTTETSKLPEIWEERPPGSKSYEVRSDVTVIPAHEVRIAISATIYWVRASNRFYVQHDSSFSSSHHFYGPFEGDPNQVLTAPTSRPTGR